MKAVPTSRTSPLALAAVIVLQGCASQGVQQRVDQDANRVVAPSAAASSGPTLASKAGASVAGGSVDADRRATEQSSRTVLRRAQTPWIASVSVPMGSGDRLPSAFQEHVEINFPGGKFSLRAVADRITAVTGVPVRLKADTHAASQGAPTPTSVAMPPGVALPVPLPGVISPAAPSASQWPAQVNSANRDPVLDAVSMRWSGSLEGYLNHITDLTGLSWEYRDGVVIIEKFRTEFFEVAALDGETAYSLGLNASDQGSPNSGAGTQGGPGGNSANADVTDKGKASSIATILSAVHQIIRDVPGSSAVRSEGSGRITVTTTKETMTKVREFIRAENDSLLRQAQIQFDIYSVRSSEGSEQGIDWSLVLRSLSDASALKINSPTTLTGPSSGEIGFSILSTSATQSSRAVRFADSSAILKLLNEQGTATQHRPVSLLTLNRQWARKASLGSQAYVSETTPGAASSASTAAGAPGIKTATVTTGDRYLAQPHILDNNTVLLKFGIGLSSLVGLPSFVTAGQTVQTPEVTHIIDQSTIALKAGQVLVITGLSRIVTNDNTRSLGEDAPTGIGGSKKLSRQREDFIIFVRPTIL